MSEQSKTIRLGDYMNGKFYSTAEFEFERLEHDRNEVSVILTKTKGSDPDRMHHIHLNVPSELLFAIAASHAQAQSRQEFYRGHDP